MILYFTQFKCRKNSLHAASTFVGTFSLIFLQIKKTNSLAYFMAFFELLHFRVVNFNDEDTVLGKARQNILLYTPLKSFTEPTCFPLQVQGSVNLPRPSKCSRFLQVKLNLWFNTASLSLIQSIIRPLLGPVLI